MEHFPALAAELAVPQAQNPTSPKRPTSGGSRKKLEIANSHAVCGKEDELESCPDMNGLRGVLADPSDLQLCISSDLASSPTGQDGVHEKVLQLGAYQPAQSEISTELSAASAADGPLESSSEVCGFMWRVNWWMLKSVLPSSVLCVIQISLLFQMWVHWDGYVLDRAQKGERISFAEFVPFYHGHWMPHHVFYGLCLAGNGVWFWALCRSLISWEHAYLPQRYFDAISFCICSVATFLFATGKTFQALDETYAFLTQGPLDINLLLYLVQYLLISTLSAVCTRRIAFFAIPIGSFGIALVVAMVFYGMKAEDRSSLTTRTSLLIMLLLAKSVFGTLVTSFVTGHLVDPQHRGTGRIEASQAHRVHLMLLLVVPLGLRALQTESSSVEELLVLQTVFCVMEIMGVWMVSRWHDVRSQVVKTVRALMSLAWRSTGKTTYRAYKRDSSMLSARSISTLSSSDQQELQHKKETADHLGVMWIIESQMADFVVLCSYVAFASFFRLVSDPGIHKYDASKLAITASILLVSELFLTNQIVLWLIARYGGGKVFGRLSAARVEGAIRKTTEVSGPGSYIVMWTGIAIWHCSMVDLAMENKCPYVNSDNTTVSYIAPCPSSVSP